MDADKKGSHIVPHFLLKRIENIDGKVDRDYEIGFKIDGITSTPHFGRSVLPERLEETFGELSDDFIANNKHPLVVDNFLCSSCEERLAQIEGKYSDTLNKVENSDYESGIDSSNGLLFWISVFWRMSVYGNSGVKLSGEQNEILRRALDTYLPKKQETLNQSAFASDGQVKSMSYKVLRALDVNQDDSKWLLFHPEFEKSPCLFIDEFIVVFSFDGNYTEFDEKDCFETNEIICDAPNNLPSGEEQVKPFDKAIYDSVNKKMVDKIVEVAIKELFEICDEIHVRAGGKGKEMPIELKRKIAWEIVNSENEMGRKYTKEELAKSIFEAIKKNAP